MKPTRRRLVSLETFRPFVGKSLSEWKASLDDEEMPSFLVFPVHMEGRPVANVVLKENSHGRYRLAAIETGIRPAAVGPQGKGWRRGPGASGVSDRRGLGQPIILADENAVAVTSESACQMPADAHAVAWRMGFPDF